MGLIAEGRFMRFMGVYETSRFHSENFIILRILLLTNGFRRFMGFCKRGSDCRRLVYEVYGNFAKEGLVTKVGLGRFIGCMKLAVSILKIS